MTIGERLGYKDGDTYKRLMQLYRVKTDKPKKKEINLGDSINNLMKVDSYSRINGRIKKRR